MCAKIVLKKRERERERERERDEEGKISLYIKPCSTQPSLAFSPSPLYATLVAGAL